MAFSIQKLIELEDSSSIMVETRQKAVKHALQRYRDGKSSPEEKAALIQAMKIYRTIAKDGKARVYNELLCFYFAENPLDSYKTAARFNINRRTLFKDIDKGVKDLTVILYGIGGVELLTEEESPAFIKAKLQEAIAKKLTEEFGRR